MPIDVRQYIEQLAQTAGLSDEEKANVLKVVSNEKFSKALGDDVLRQQDYSRNMDGLRADRQKWEKWYADSLQWRAEEEARLQALANGNANADPYRQVNPALANFDPEAYRKQLLADIQKSNDTRDAQVVSLLKDGIGLGTRHMYEFKEPLDTEALAKIAVEKGLTLAQAYDSMVAPRRAEAQKVKYDADLKAAREEGAREFASTHKIPIDTAPREYHPLLDKRAEGPVNDYVANSGRLSPTSERSLRDTFTAEWEKEGARQSALERVGTSGT
jgi:hypothetical protein